jgi:hypothetical protein
MAAIQNAQSEKMTMTLEKTKVDADIASPHAVDKTVRRLDDFPELVKPCAMATGWLPVCFSLSCLMAIATRLGAPERSTK